MKLDSAQNIAEPLARKLRMDVRPSGEIPELRIVTDVFVIPGLDALYDSDGRRIEITKRAYVPEDMDVAAQSRERVAKTYEKYCPETIVLPETFDDIDHMVMLGGHAWDHYGHFIIDVMSRFWALAHVVESIPILYLDRVSKFTGTPFADFIVNALQVKDRLFRCKRPTRLRLALLPEPAIQHAYRIYHTHAYPHVSVAHAVRSGRSDFADKRVYLSRSGLRQDLRKSPDEQQVEDRAVQLGFEIVHPEALTMLDQINIFNDASVIAGMSGSAFHTVLFCTSLITPKLVQFSWGKVNQRYLMIDKIKNARSIYVGSGKIAQVSDRSRIEVVNLDVEMCLDAMSDAITDKH